MLDPDFNIIKYLKKQNGMRIIFKSHLKKYEIYFHFGLLAINPPHSQMTSYPLAISVRFSSPSPK